MSQYLLETIDGADPSQYDVRVEYVTPSVCLTSTEYAVIGFPPSDGLVQTILTDVYPMIKKVGVLI